jgi:hypothetical protein
LLVFFKSAISRFNSYSTISTHFQYLVICSINVYIQMTALPN